MQWLGAFCCTMLWGFTCHGQTLTWATSKTQAMATAISQGKLVLLMAGRHTCPNCNYMQNTVCEMTSPPIKPLIQRRYVPWFCEVDSSSEYRVYATGLGSFTLPLICCIDPTDPDNYLDRTTSVQDPQVFYNRLLARAGPTNVLMRCLAASNGLVRLAVTNLTFGITNRVERCFDPQSTGVWTVVATFVSPALATNWWEPASDTWQRAFYRIVSQR